MSLPPQQPPTPAADSAGLNTGTFANLIRYWVHYDTVINDLNKQVREARDTRAAYEAQILSMLSASSLKSPVIQIGGGRLVVATERQSQPLNYKTIETLLHQYYRERPGSKDDTADILQFFKERREVTTSQVLRRQRPSVSLRAKEK